MVNSCRISSINSSKLFRDVLGMEVSELESNYIRRQVVRVAKDESPLNSLCFFVTFEG